MQCVKHVASHVIMPWLADSEWTLDLRQGETPSLVDGPPKTEPDLRVTINDDNFANLVSGKLGQQKVGFDEARRLPVRWRMYDSALGSNRDIEHRVCSHRHSCWGS